jgi:hypothetical protein
VRERPADIRDSDVTAALARQWALTVQDMSYLPVGFGGYHWLAVDQTGSRWFVTVSDLATPWVPDLPAAMQTAAWLATQAGLEFVVAPVIRRRSRGRAGLLAIALVVSAVARSVPVIGPVSAPASVEEAPTGANLICYGTNDS